MNIFEKDIIYIDTIDTFNELKKNIKQFNKCKKIRFGWFYNKKIDIYPKKLKILIIDGMYDEDLPSFENTNIKTVVISHVSRYNKELPSLKNTNIKQISFGYNYNQLLPCLKYTKLKVLLFGYSFDRPLPDLKDTNVKYILFENYYHHPLPNLRNTKVKYLSLCIDDASYPQQLYYQYTNVKYIIYRSLYSSKFDIDLENTNIKMLYYYSSFKINIKNSYNLHKIKLSCEKVNINKYTNQIYNIENNTFSYIIKKNLIPYLKYIKYNNIYIPFEIYNYIYMNFNFTFDAIIK